MFPSFSNCSFKFFHLCLQFFSFFQSYAEARDFVLAFLEIVELQAQELKKGQGNFFCVGPILEFPSFELGSSWRCQKKKENTRPPTFSIESQRPSDIYLCWVNEETFELCARKLVEGLNTTLLTLARYGVSQDRAWKLKKGRM